MKKIIIFIVSFIICSTVLIANPTNKPMPFSQVKKGMTGYGYTVFEGNKRIKFGVEILAVLKNYQNNGKTIIAKIDSYHKYKKIGIIAGMSGAPIYINGKIIGALSKTLEKNKNNVALITPINKMLKLFPKHILNIKPNFINLFPGDSVLITPTLGEITFPHIGTITIIKGKYFLALGHEINLDENSEFFIHLASIKLIAENDNLNYKIGQSKTLVGKVIRDTKYGILCEIIKRPKYINININILTSKNKKMFKLKMIDSQYTFKAYIQNLIRDTIDNALENNNYKTYEFECNILQGEKHIIHLGNIYSKKYNIISDSAENISDEIIKLLNNKFEKINFTNINLKIKFITESKIANLVNVKILNPKLKYGKLLKLKFYFKIHQKKNDIKIIYIEEKLNVGDYTVVISKTPYSKSKITDAKNLFQYLNLYENKIKNNELYFIIYSTKNKIVLLKKLYFENVVFLEHNISNKIIVDSNFAIKDVNNNVNNI